MGEESQVVLYGLWASSYVKRVELALKLKGIPFQYVEEDYRHKSPSLLQYNPVHKKVPVLVHNGKPICESLVILEYIDETWPNEPQLLPKDAYQRAQVRFWASYIDQIVETTKKFIDPDKEMQKKALEEVNEKLMKMEDGMKSLFPGGGCPDEVHADKMGMLDILMAVVFCTMKIQQVYGVKLIDPQRNPLLSSWIQALNQVPLVNEIAPPLEKLVELFQFLIRRGIKMT